MLLLQEFAIPLSFKIYGALDYDLIRKKIKDYIGVDCNIVKPSEFIIHFKEHNVPLVNLFTEKQSKIDKLVAVTTPKPKEGTILKLIDKALKPSSTNQRHVAGFFEPSTKIVVITFLLNNQIYDPYNFHIDKLNTDTYFLMARLIVHELTHYSYNNRNNFKEYIKPLMRKFYYRFYSMLFYNEDSLNRMLGLYNQIIDNEDMDKLDHVLNQIKKILKENYHHLKDKELANDIIHTINTLISGGNLVETLIRARTMQKAFASVYETFGVVNSAVRMPVFGQELYVASEIACIIGDHFITRNQTSLKVASAMLKYL